MRPIVHGLEAEYWGEVDFVYLDREANSNSDIVQKFGIFGQPVLIFLAPDGETIIKQWFGRVDAATLSAEFDAYLEG